ncbi:PocR ligand-binding domain-containing protein [Vallitalea okinawensis]|uniref:PocR ligand-binding domain-containing protein n=1 Tax=Vallitalea okinawensis TaxID=2078660 RepID=UPI001478A891|nr:PocR ligand-binding domain-containing protein [Vallitalea okinawensis]
MKKDIIDDAIEKINIFSTSTGLEGRLIDKCGKTLYASFDQNNRCKVCDCIDRKRCEESHLFGAYQAELFGGSYIFFCPIGLVHFASPIIIQQEMVGAILGGHVLMTPPDDYLYTNLLKYQLDMEEIKLSFSKIKIQDTKKVLALSQLLQILAEQVSDSTFRNIQSKLTSNMIGLSQAKHTHAIHKAMHYIQTNYMNKLTLNDIAEHVHFTPPYFCKIFKEETGYSFNKHLNKVRIEKSLDLLEEGIPQSEIAYLVGFSDQSHYSRHFKQVMNMSPREYKNQHH